ncbi:MAG: response regulator transcription factor [Clostridia bacterium]|nr:response regulator transcription factor [Clostridia bacterium]
MVRIAIVEDSEQDSHRLQTCLDRYGAEKDVKMQTSWHRSAEEFLDSFQYQYDIVFMDIRMGGMDGMKAAHKLREKDDKVILIFLTSLAQYAVQGYEVDALDYILKPLTYPALELKFQRALRRCHPKEDEEEILIASGTERYRVKAEELFYIEVFEHHLHYKTARETIKGYGTLKDVEKLLPEKGFFRLNNQTIVNLRHIQQIRGNTAVLDGREFDISRMRKKDFMAEFHRYGLRI